MFEIAPFKQRLLENVAELIEARQMFQVATTKMNGLGETRLSSQYLSDIPGALTRLLKSRFSEVEIQLTAEYSNGLPVNITTNEQFYRFVSHPYSGDTRYLSDALNDELKAVEGKSPHEQVLALENTVHNMPWSKIKEDFDSQCLNTKKSGMSACTLTVHDFFSIDKRYNKAVFKNGCLVATRDYTGESWDIRGYIQAISNVQDALGPIVAEANLDIGDSLQALLTALEKTYHSRQPIPMRTRFGKGSAIDVTVFKTKITFTLSPAVVEAIQASTVLYCDEHVIDSFMNLMDETPA
ncbi:hypothetical protein [Halomonas sp. KO116]|uniref:hypothetical protein n=1 Tax=Halomonas sp. KO116 TaxID=1504981 RepID=UPI0004E35EF8|nr:hypothetical protein [Halomonas sp. KO116]AJY53301.1 hypothetical protein KO116_P200194 [Halomonas sp. KO116]